jgi:hypothetical protein
MSSQPAPRNLTAKARASRPVRDAVGNPASARLEAAVGNCFPGLEWDVRVLEGRFFPGLRFWVVTEPLAPVPEALPHQQGILLKYLDYLTDPMLPERSSLPWVQTLLSTYAGSTGRALSQGRWYLHWLEQDGHRVGCEDNSGNPFDGELLWRFVRCLAPGPLKIALINRAAPAPQPVIELVGERRLYAPGGVVDSAYPPGELTESMCNPWQHDFRDCACYYWASNHPDVVLGSTSQASLPDGAPAGVEAAVTWLDWLRRDKTAAGNVAATSSRAQARSLQMDHFEINRRWQELDFVVGGREIDKVYHPPARDRAKPYADTAELIRELSEQLAPLELTLAYQYLYGLFSLKAPDEAPAAWATMPADLTSARQFITLVAVGEMTHLRWANQILWELDRAGLYPPGQHYTPVVKPLLTPFRLGGVEVPVLAPLTLPTLQAYVRIERPGGALDTAYARCVATLAQPAYPKNLHELAVRIDSDGTHHFERFRQVHRTMQGYAGAPGTEPYLRPVQPGTLQSAAAALQPLDALVAALQTAYADEAAGRMAQAQKSIDDARLLMERFRSAAESLAQQGVGVPFFGAP